ncbi:MAG: DNA mismatch repair protein MutS, partial [Deltaproteobacteria bacterium]
MGNVSHGKTAVQAAGVKQTPMLKQYLKIKAQYPDSILFFRLGDFYEMFFEDAELASDLLDLVLTSRTKGKDSYPMCGVPAFAASGYIRKLVEAGHKVAICEQVEDPAKAKGIVQREVVQVVSPGLVLDDESLEGKSSNYLAAVVEREDRIGLAYLDVSTGDFLMTELARSQFEDELGRVHPRELLAGGELASWVEKVVQKNELGCFCRRLEDSDALAGCIDDAAERKLFAHHPDSAGLAAARLLYGYVASALPASLAHIHRLVPYSVSDHMVIDNNTRQNLELTASLMEGGRRGSLLGAIDRTLTPMGARLLGRWLLYPLLEPAAISRRLDAVEQLVTDSILRGDLRQRLRQIRDLERACARVTAARQPSPRHMAQLRDSLRALPEWAELVRGCQQGPVGQLVGPPDDLRDLLERLEDALVEDPPADTAEGGFIRPGYHPRLAELERLSSSARQVIAEMEERERQA